GILSSSAKSTPIPCKSVQKAFRREVRQQSAPSAAALPLLVGFVDPAGAVHRLPVVPFQYRSPLLPARWYDACIAFGSLSRSLMNAPITLRSSGVRSGFTGTSRIYSTASLLASLLGVFAASNKSASASTISRPSLVSWSMSYSLVIG